MPRIDLLTTITVAFVMAIGALTGPAAFPAQPSPSISPAVVAAQQRGANVTVSRFGAVGDGQTDDTAAIQAAIDHSARVYLPAGTYRINPRVGLVLRTGTHLVGDGRTSTILVASAGGGTIGELADYGPGSLLHRRFNPVGRNAYVTSVYLADFSVILTHPRDSVTQREIQIGIDFRNVTRSIIERVHVGNVPFEGSRLSKAGAHVYDSQGYGIVFGSVQSSLLSYAGGEINSARDSSIWGAYKAIVQDDAILSPRSAAHATLIERNDIQGAQALLSQESRYTEAFVWRDNILQNVVPRPDGVRSASVMHVDGQNGRIEGGYIEAGGLASILYYLGPDAGNNRIDAAFVSCTNTPLVVDRGRNNRLALSSGCKAIRSDGAASPSPP